MPHFNLPEKGYKFPFVIFVRKSLRLAIHFVEYMAPNRKMGFGDTFNGNLVTPSFPKK